MKRYPWLFRLAISSRPAKPGRHNEDGAAYLLPQRSWSRRGSLFAVADGVGGRPCGSVAARITVMTFIRAYYRGRGNETRRLQQAAELSHQALRRYGQKYPSCRGLASTLAALLVSRDRFYVIHVGDTRAYVVRDHSVIGLTKDHTLSAQMEAHYGYSVPRYRHVLAQAMGGEQGVHPDIVSHRVHPGDNFLIVTDGVYRYLAPEHIGWFVERYAPTQAAKLIEVWARNAGSPDDRTVLIVQALPALRVRAYAGRYNLWRSSYGYAH